jgi:Uma2 family endonuclease
MIKPMNAPHSIAVFSAADYLHWESQQTEKYEFLNGEVFAMGGASRRHVTIAGNLFSALDQALEDSPCRAYMADMKVQAHADCAYFYPDVLVTCDPADHKADYYMSAPCLIVEVLSPATAGYDRGEKFAAYRQLASLQDFVLIDPQRRHIEHYVKTAQGLWQLSDIVAEQPLVFTRLDITIPWARIFRNVN